MLKRDSLERQMFALPDINSYFHKFITCLGFTVVLLLITWPFTELYLFAEMADQISGTPHFSFDNQKRAERFIRIKCNQCHLHVPDAGANIEPTLVKGYENICITCHRHTPESCRLMVKPKIYNTLKAQIPDFPLKLFSGSVICSSCHRVHEVKTDKTEADRLKEGYETLKKEAENINIHKTGVFCFLCHEKEPREKGRPLYLKYKQDTIKLCKECHDNKRARADNHPVGVVPSEEKKKRIPKDFPLTDGKLTCVTCHHLRCQEGKENPLFLRGGPYRKRLETCLVCHVKEQYQKTNPHDSISDDGEIREDRCFFCHAVDTNEKGEKKLGFKFKAPFRLYCVGCHPNKEKKHPFGADHTGRYIDSIWTGLSMTDRLNISHNQSFKITPVSLSGRLMCASCHNPHDTRPGPKLRIDDINKSCRQCHFQHYGDKSSPTMRESENLSDTQVSAPKGEDHQPFGYIASLRFYCVGCHPNKEKKHPFGIDHIGKFIRNFGRHFSNKQRIRLSQAETSQIIPLTTNGQVACFTCHNPHDGQKGKKLRLKEMDLLCSFCHPDQSKIGNAQNKKAPN